MKRIVFILTLVLILAPATVLAVAPLALPAYELVNFNIGEVQMLGFPAGDVRATVGFYGTSSVPATTAANGTAPWELIPTLPSAPTGLFTEGGECMPGLTELADASEATGNPRAMFPIMLAFGLALLAGFGVYGATHNTRAGQRGSIFLQSITSLAVMIFFYVGGCGVIPGWSLIPFGVQALFLLVGRNPQHSST